METADTSEEASITLRVLQDACGSFWFLYCIPFTRRLLWLIFPESCLQMREIGVTSFEAEQHDPSAVEAMHDL